MDQKELIEALVSGGMDIHNATRKARIIQQRADAAEAEKEAEKKPAEEDDSKSDGGPQ